MDDRYASKLRGTTHNFAFSGLIKCGHCGCAVVSEIKKQKYIYYHCAGFKGKCGEPYAREEVIETQFASLLKQLRFDEDVFNWMRKALRESFHDERRENADAIKRLIKERDRLQQRIKAIYIDKVNGKIDDEFHDRMRDEWREEQERCLRDIERHQTADDSYMDEGVSLLQLAKDAHRLFEKQSAQEKSRLLNFLFSNSTWKNGELTADFKQLFDFLEKNRHSRANKNDRNPRFQPF